MIESIKVFVLGAVVGTGTAVLLDDQSGLWIYNPPNSVDAWWKGFPGQYVALIASDSAVFGENHYLRVIRSYNHGEIILIDISDEDEEGA
jgi:hypothetical protein